MKFRSRSQMNRSRPISRRAVDHSDQSPLVPNQRLVLLPSRSRIMKMKAPSLTITMMSKPNSMRKLKKSNKKKQKDRETKLIQASRIKMRKGTIKVNQITVNNWTTSFRKSIDSKGLGLSRSAKICQIGCFVLTKKLQ